MNTSPRLSLALLGLVLFAALATPVASISAGAAEASPGEAHSFGLGVIFGEPTGLTGKVFTGARDAFDFGTAYSFHSYLLLYADKLWHFDVFKTNDDFGRHATLYAGIGAGVFLASDTRVNVRIPVGIEWRPSEPRLGVFLELVPAVRVAPNVTGDFGGGVGVRYYF